MTENYNNLIQILDFFPDICGIVLRMSEQFPRYTHYSDVDILCEDIKHSEKVIKNIHAKKYGRFKLRTEITPNDSKHKKLDFHLPNNVVYGIGPQGVMSSLNLRFDLYSSLDNYKKSKVSGEYTGLVFNRAKIKMFGEIPVKIPDIIDETVIRYLEFTDHPHKTKHRDFYMNHCTPEFIKTLDKYIS